ncbi:OmpA family protein [Kineococcus sp. NUM-3379]
MRDGARPRPAAVRPAAPRPAADRPAAPRPAADRPVSRGVRATGVLAALALAGTAACTAGGPDAGGPGGAGDPRSAPTPRTSPAAPPSGSPSSSPSGSPAGTPSGSPAGAAGDAVRRLRERLAPPALPSFALPADVLTDAGSRQVAERLRVLPGLYRGIAVLDARCGGAGTARAADAGAASTGAAGSAREGEVSVTVAGDGTGVYDAPGLHVAVLPGGAGVHDDGRVRLSVQADGSGTYSSPDLRVFVRADGSGSYEGGGVRLWVAPDGTGSYDGPEGRVRVGASGAEPGDAESGFARAVETVVREGLPPFPSVPRITRVQQAGRACGTVVRLDAGVLFGVDSAEVRPDGQELLVRVSGLLAALGSPAVDVVGHTDSSGDGGYNQALSERRAAAVADRLAALGAPRSTLRPAGRGEEEPVRPDVAADGAPDPAARQLNRRVELVLPQAAEPAP